MLKKRKIAQSLVEYAVVFSVVVAAILIMQAFIKRGYQGSLKDAADKMGEQYSAGNTSIYQNRSLSQEGQTIMHQAGTTAKAQTVLSTLGISGVTTQNITAQDVLSVDSRTGGNMTSETKVQTDSLKREATRLNEYANVTQTDFPAPY
ncbi:MAG: hypothetical protein PHF11_04885 [Candidatus Omnitrophica bacterium]|nr:hypothetical protein [Candidatus Omnitrophota bacterium]